MTSKSLIINSPYEHCRVDLATACGCVFDPRGVALNEVGFPSYLRRNNTRQGYARKCTLKLAGYSFYGAAVTKKPFVKPAFSIAQQVEQLRTREMEVGDDARAAFYLQHLNPCRLGACWIPSSPNNDPSSPNNDPSSLNNDPSYPNNDPSSESNDSTAADLVGGRRSRTATIQIVLEFCREEYRTPKEIALHLRRDVKYVKRWVLSELLLGNKLQARYPENPTHPQQAYRTTDP
jgi:hypothetical protein